jgi:type VI secretion system protein ImpJ
MSSQLVLGVRRHSEQSEQDLVAWMEGCLIGSENRIETMRENRVLGAARQQIGDDDELVAARGMVFFSLAADSRFIESNEVLQVFNSEDPSGARRPAELVLYIKNLT